MTEETTLTDRLAALLDQEKAALLDGDFDRIAELMDEKQALISALEGKGSATGDLAPLRDGLRRNQELFDQALAGIRNVAARLGDLNRIRKSMNTYDAQGRPQVIDAPDTKRLEKRA